MIDAACNYLNPYATASLAAMPTSVATSATDYAASSVALYNNKSGMPSSACNPMKMEMQYPPQASSTGSASPNSSIQSAPSSASVSPSIFPSPAQSFASISSSPPVSATSPLSGSPITAGHTDLGATSAAYSWNTYSTLPTRTQFPYAQYASDYYGNVGMSASAAAAGAWFSHQDRLYQPWSSQTYPSFNFDDIAFQTQLQRRSVRCTCPNCANEMSGLPPIVGPDDRGRKQHICHIPGCERLYGKASHLKTHLRWHTGERPFLCLTCGKRFSRSDELQRHGRTHTNYRPYACPICSKKFSRSDHLSKHKKTHFKDKKSKKAIAAEAKEQAAAAVAASAKQDKSLELQDKMSATNKTVANITPASPTIVGVTNNVVDPVVSACTTGKPTSARQQQQTEQIQLKTEQPDIPSGYNPYSNLYHQSSSLFSHTHHLASSSRASYGLHQTASQQPTTSFDIWNSHHHHHHTRSAIEHQSPNNSTIANATSTSTATPNLQQQHQPTAPTSSSSHHYAALAMQSESQLAAEYGLTMSSVGPPSPVNHIQHSASTYPGLIAQMKTEYPTYPEFSTNSGYTSAGAFHHHPHNPWTAAAAYQNPHTTV